MSDTSGGTQSSTPHDGPSTHSTGDPRVDAAVARLSELDDLSVHDHAAVVEDVHRALRDVLAEDQD